MIKPLVLWMAASLIWTSASTAQSPGDSPRLVLTDGQGTTVPGPSGPFDNSGVFSAFSGMSFEADVTYQAVAQPNSNVFWALLVSGAKTPYPTSTLPPPLFTMPPFILLLPVPPTLTGGGFGQLPLFVPAGVYSAQTYVQGLVFDVTSSPSLRLTNGLTVTVDVPEFSINFAFVRSKPAGGDGQLRDVGVIDVDAQTLNTLKPIGSSAPPLAVADPAPLFDDYRFLPILPNTAAEPVNPRARPMTRIVGSVSGTATELPVEDTAFFPTRGRLLIAFASGTAPAPNPWTAKSVDGLTGPNVEIVAYDGTTPTSFLNCQRVQLGSRGSTDFVHINGEIVLGFFTMATTADARLRTSVALDADNRDLPHVVIPKFTVEAGPDTGPVPLDLDLYIYETLANKVQGFMVMDRVTGQWRAIPGTEKNDQEGRWDPMVALAPDGRSLIARVQVSGSCAGCPVWDNLPDVLYAIRVDGLNWPATGTQVWQIPYQTEPDPTSVFDVNVRSRRVWMPATSIIGPDPDNFVAYVGLADKWKFTAGNPGVVGVANVGFEAEYVNEEVLVHDLVECPLIMPGSTKSLPTVPRPYITTAFGNTGLLKPITRFDPEVLRFANGAQLLLTAGNTDEQEDVFVIRNVSVTQTGVANKTLANLSAYNNSTQSGGETLVRAFNPGCGQGQSGRVAISPNGLRAAWVARDKKSLGGQRRDWLQIGFTNGASFGKVNHIYANSSDVFQETGPLTSDRVISNLRFIDDNRVVFMMGLNRYDDPLAFSAANTPATDLFVYDIVDKVMTNLTNTGGSANGFSQLGKITPAGSFGSPGGEYVYFLRAGGISSQQQSSNPALILPTGTAVLNVLGLNVATQDSFPMTGTELDASALIGNLVLPATDMSAPVETAAAMRFVEATDVQEDMLYFSTHRVGGNGSDDVFAINRDMPFVAFAATGATKPGVHVSNILPDPYSAKVAFARTDTADAYSSTQHPYVVDLDNFLFERDLLPSYKSGGNALGRVMDGSFHFIAPVGSAGDALLFSFGLTSLNGIAGIATPAYYPLGAVSDLLAEPIPVIIPLVDTFLLGTDYRFYLTAAGPSAGN